MTSIKARSRQIAAALGIAMAAGTAAQAQDIGTSFPPGFVVGADASTGLPWIGFGSDVGTVTRTPVIFLHGNDDVPYHDATTCGRTGVDMRGMAQAFVNAGYAPRELWALGWQGTQCDQATTGWSLSASASHSVAANVQDLRAFVAAVVDYTGASRVDIVAHGMGVVLAREWVRQDRARSIARRLIAIDGPNGGTLMCADYAGNPWQLAFIGGYVPSSPVCQELGAPQTPLLSGINDARDGSRFLPKDILVIRNGDVSWPYMTAPDSLAPQVTQSLDLYGNPTDFTFSASIRRARELSLTGQGQYDPKGLTAHAGIANSPVAHTEAISFLSGLGSPLP